jgi:2,3-bisphosphoglycerate-dependent phosphoglycerate mutase
LPKLTQHTPIYHITLLRHAESLGNAGGYYQGQTDYELSEKGSLQAKALANRWKSEAVHIDRIISSPLKRAAQTADQIAQAINSPIETNPDWMERNAGLISGLHQDTVKFNYPKPDFMHIYQPFAETGESQWQLFLRAGRAIQNLFKYPTGHYLIVSHGGILNMALYAILGIAPQANFEGAYFYHDNAGFTQLSYYPESHNWIMLKFNDTNHLIHLNSN